MRLRLSLVVGVLAAVLATSAGAAPWDSLEQKASEMRGGGKLLLTGGVSNVEGAGGGGLATWAVTTGMATRDGIGANVHATAVDLPDYSLRSWGVAAGVFDRLELSYAHQAFDTGATGAKLGLGRGFTFNQQIWGAKVKLVGDAVYGQDSWAPQVSAGVQFKSNDKGAIVRAVGGKDDKGVDYYLAATKVLLDQSLVLDGTLRMTKANQFGLLGFGGDRRSAYSLQFEGSAAYLLTRRLAVGAEYRSKPDNLGFAKEDDAYDLFAAFALNKHLSATAAYVDLGDIATFRGQRGLYLSLQAGF